MTTLEIIAVVISLLSISINIFVLLYVTSED